MSTTTAANENFVPQKGYPTMITLSELEKNSMSVDESEKRIGELIHDFYHKKA